MSGPTAPSPADAQHAAELARVEAYFTTSKLAGDEIAWVQQYGLPVLWLEVRRLRAELARRAGSSL